jgi:hypothetical protein
MNSRAALVGELGVVHADRARLAKDVVDAAARGRQFIVDAEAEAARLVAGAQDLAQDGEHRYADAYGAATAGGWTATDLTVLGFQPVASGRRRRPAVEQPELVPQVATVPERSAEQEPQPAAAAPQ